MPKGPIPSQLKETSLQNTIIDQTRTLLTRSAPQFLDWSERCRRFLMDADGLVYDYERDVFVADAVFLRLQRHLPWTFAASDPEFVWQAPAQVRRELGELLRRVLSFWQAGDAQAVKTKSLHEDPVVGQPLGKAVLNFVKAHAVHCQAFSVFLGLYADNVDEALWKLLHMTANCTAWSAKPSTAREIIQIMSAS